MAHEFKIKNALQILNTQPISGIYSDPSIFNIADNSSLATVSAIKTYIDNNIVSWSSPVSSSLIPSVPSTFDLGSSANTFDNLYLDGSIYINGSVFSGGGSGMDWSLPVDANIVPLTDATYNLGSINKGFGYLYLCSGIKTSFLGYDVLKHTGAIASITLGVEAGKNLNQFSFGNTFIGDHAGNNTNDSAANYNTFVGQTSGYNNTVGYNNTYIGSAAGSNNTSGYGNVFIGADAGKYETGSNLLYIANSSTNVPLIKGYFDYNYIHLNGAVNINPVNGVNSDMHIAGSITITNGGMLRTYSDGSIYASGDIVTEKIMYIGSPTVDGSWRYRIDGNNLVYERRESSIWVIKQTILA